MNSFGQREHIMQNENNDTSGREQRTSLLLDAPVELVWEVWTKPEHIKHWWGPNGFTNTIEKCKCKPEANGFSSCMGLMEKITQTEPFSGKLLSAKN